MPPTLRASTDQLLEQSKIACENKSFHRSQQLAFQALSRKNSKTEPPLRQWFQEAYDDGRFAEALAINLALADYFKDDISLHNITGRLYAALGDYDAAKLAFEHCLTLNPRFSFARYNLAALAAKVPLYDKEAQLAIKGLSQRKSFLWPHFLSNLPTVNHHCNKIALEKREVEINDLGQRIRKKALSHHYKDIEQAIELCHQVDSLQSSDITIKVEDSWRLVADQLAAHLHLNLDDRVDQAVESNGIALGLHFIQLKEFKQANKIFSQLLSNEKHSMYLELLSGLCLAETGDLAKALKLLQQGFTKHPENRYYCYNIGLCLQVLKKQNQASIYFLRTAFSLGKTGGGFSPKDILSRANALLVQGEPQKPVQYLEVLDSMHRTATGLKSLCKAHLAERDFKRAYDIAMAFEDFVPLEPELKLEKNEDPLSHFFQTSTEKLYRSNEISDAAQGYHFTAKLTQDPAHYKLAIKLYRNLEQPQIASQIELELESSVKENNQKSNLSKFDELFEAGKSALSQKKYQQAIIAFEAALLVKGDQQVVAYLYKIYSSLNQPRALKELIKTWKWLSEKGGDLGAVQVF